MPKVIELPPPLDVELYHVREAARLLKLQTITLKRWLEGAHISGTFYEPVIREEPIDSDVVTWAEFVEAGFLRDYRKAKDIPMQRLRPFIKQLREDTGVPYPLAHFRPLVDTVARDAVLKGQEELGLPDDELLLRRVGPRDSVGAWQVQWAEPVRQFLETVEFDAQAVAQRMLPLGKDGRVTIDPRVVFGIPQVGGIRTEILLESYAELGNEQRVAKEWDIDPDDVRAAIQWEAGLRKAA